MFIIKCILRRKLIILRVQKGLYFYRFGKNNELVRCGVFKYVWDTEKKTWGNMDTYKACWFYQLVEVIYIFQNFLPCSLTF